MRPNTNESPYASKMPRFQVPTTKLLSDVLAATLGLPLDVPRSAIEGLLGIGSVTLSFLAGWLYIQMAAKTVIQILSTKNVGVGVDLKSNSGE